MNIKKIVRIFDYFFTLIKDLSKKINEFLMNEYFLRSKITPIL